MERLDFTLPPFVRISWVSDAARGVYTPRIERIARAWSRLEWLTVASGVRRCAITTQTPEQYVALVGELTRHGLFSAPVDTQSHATAGYAFRLVVGRPADLAEFQAALGEGDENTLSDLLGTPACCREFLGSVYEQDIQDVTWPVALATERPNEDGRTISLHCTPHTNILWNALGVRAIPHVPCSHYCDDSFRLANQFIDAGNEAGFAAEMEWLREILSWPVEWSALHGIAETKTPVLRIISATDATSVKYTVRYRGTVHPEEAVHGLSFPYLPSDKPRFTETKNFLRGLAHPITLHTNVPRKTKGETSESESRTTV